MNKKGNFLETSIIYAVSALIIGIVVVFMFIIVNNFNDGIQNTNTTLIDDEIKNISNNQVNKYENLDRAFGFILLAFIVMSIILARRLEEVPPTYIVFGILGLVAIGFFGMIIENIWTSFISENTINATTSGLTFIPFIMNNLLITLIIIVALVIIARLSRDVGGGI